MASALTHFPRALLADRDGPCVSLYQPTARRHPENQQDPIRFRNLVRDIERALRSEHGDDTADALLAGFESLAGDREFWNHTHDGLAVFAAADGLFRVYRLQRSVPERAVVARSFHLKPLLRIHQSADRYQVLGINRREIRLFEGNRDALAEIEPAPGVPRTIEDALGSELTEPHHEVATYGSGATGPAMVHGHGGKKDEVDSDAERFFRAVDRAVLEHHSQPSELPLVLAALPEYHAVFRRVSHNPLLLPQAIDVHPDDLSIEALTERAWRAVEPDYLSRLAGLVEDFGWARSAGLGTDDLAQAADAAVNGRVETLLLEAERQEPAELDDLGENVLKTGGNVVIVPAARMPTDTGIAATYRF